MPDTEISPRISTKIGRKQHVFEHFTSGALTAAANKYEWIVPFYCSIVDVMVDSEGAGVGTNTTIIDVNRNGTTIFTDQTNRPTLRPNDTGFYDRQADGIEPRKAPAIIRLVPGDVLSYDVDQIQSTSGNTRTKVAIVVEDR